MKRIKTFGLVVFTALALTAVLGVAGASAAEFETESEATLSSTEGSGHLLQFHTIATECGAPELSGTLTRHSLKTEVTPKDTKCTAFGGSSTMAMNGCKFVLRPGAMSSEKQSQGAMDISCPAGKTITLSPAGCSVTIPAQNGLFATFENVGTGKESSIKVNLQATGLKHSQVSGSICKSALGTFADGKWTGSWTVRGSNAFGRVGIWLRTSGAFELPPAGIGIYNGQLNAGTYPISIAGSQSGVHVMKFSGGSAECTSAKFSSSAASATNQFTVAAEYGGCYLIAVSGSLNMNGCTYTFNVLNQAPVGSTYAGHADIACPVGKAIELASSKCTITIPAQTTDSEGLSFTNEAGSTVGLGMSIKGIDYHQVEGTGVGRCKTGDFTNGSYTGSSTLVGSY